ncbi:MAG: DUF4234 domain-containing protein [Clostridia bacterium]|nr:DUF4234 domain-containing protein [Clostridia bacterium]
MVEKRSIAKAIILSIITFGIYEIYWFIKMTNEVADITGDHNNASGGMAFFLTIITCGIYGIFWAYKMGEKLDRHEGVDGSRALIYLILMITGLGFVTYCLIQDSINKIVTK